jgi:HSP20 family protein
VNEKWRRWKRRSQWDEFFKEFDKLERMVDDLANRTTNNLSEKNDERKFPNPYVLGFSVSIGSDGKPQVYKFGSSKPSSKDIEIREEREPLLDILENEKEVIIIAELPGFGKEDVKLDVTESTIKIIVNTPERSYYKKLYLPVKVQQNSLEKSYKNGVLELHLKKVDVKLISIKKRLSQSE